MIKAIWMFFFRLCNPLSIGDPIGPILCARRVHQAGMKSEVCNWIENAEGIRHLIGTYEGPIEIHFRDERYGKVREVCVIRDVKIDQSQRPSYKHKEEPEGDFAVISIMDAEFFSRKADIDLIFGSLNVNDNRVCYAGEQYWDEDFGY